MLIIVLRLGINCPFNHAQKKSLIFTYLAAMMNKPKVSIVVPIYNVEKYFSRCMDSLLSQTLTDIEFILVDDVSPDHCPSMCDEYAQQDNRVKVIHKKKNEGFGFARNTGLEIANGEYITFVDSDDYVMPDAYRKLYSLAMDKRVDVVYFSYQRFDDQDNRWIEVNVLKERQFQTAQEIRKLVLDMIANPPDAVNDGDFPAAAAWNSFYRMDVIKRNGLQFKSERALIGEDLFFNIDFLFHSESVLTIPDTFYNYRDNSASFTRAVGADRITKTYLFYQHLLEVLRTNNFGMEGYYRSTRRFIGNSRLNICQYVQSSLPRSEKMRWLKETVNQPFWKDVALSYPYKQMPLKYAFHFYLLQKGYHRLLYAYSRLFGATKWLAARLLRASQ